MPKEIIQKQQIIDTRKTLDQIFTRNIRYLLDVIKTVTSSISQFYANSEQNKTITSTFYDYEIDPYNGLPYFDNIADMITEETSNTSGEDLTPQLAEINRRLTALESGVAALQGTVATNKQAADDAVSSLRGSISALDTRVTALEQG